MPSATGCPCHLSPDHAAGMAEDGCSCGPARRCLVSSSRVAVHCHQAPVAAARNGRNANTPSSGGCTARPAEPARVLPDVVQSSLRVRRLSWSWGAMTGDHREFLELTLPHPDAGFQVARHAARDGLDPEDLVQETYLRAFASFSRYRGGDVRAWLAALCLNAARSESRRRRRRPQEAVSQALLDVLPFGRGDGRDQAPDGARGGVAGLGAEEGCRGPAL